MTNHQKVLALGDLQLPYADYRAVSLVFDMMKWWKPTDIVAVGDIDDQLEYSRFSDGRSDDFFNTLARNQKDYEKARADYAKALAKYEGLTIPSDFEPPVEPERPNLNPLPFIKENAETARKFYHDLRAGHKRSRIFSCLGNHDIRVFDYMDRKAPDFAPDVTPDFLYDFKDLGIDYAMYDDKPSELFPGVFFHHGKTTSSNGAAVRGDISNYGISLVRGHDHHGGVFYETKPLRGDTLFGLATGHLCDVNGYGLRYAISPDWEMGFGILHIYGNEVHPQFIHIKPDYTAVLDGKLFQG